MRNEKLEIMETAQGKNQYDLLKGESFIKGFSCYNEALGHLKKIDTGFNYVNNFVSENPNGYEIVKNWHY